ncbi:MULTISPECIES: tripartite tricarboxylate transporter substrate binding protein [unclassified Roseateles]|uniref:Bug family tripartite tricarboxylate transporter substrate binding protein n=1 Tax=unclassified Roseateles TaxID=2626991 RepID=UPI0007003563|nr:MULTISPECIES: tripartite tricarboxylate transporter substrate binding protein [unclassified Roseateles]KQW44915.1 LacI family transcriptional regulator [Pelomonas sp. Root405]KRA70275.1 LacI family transcriptional regulator [Pelomonas sp. Root662]
MKRLLTSVLLSLTALSITGTAVAQAWPAKPVTLLVPFPPGGSTDAIARLLSNKLPESVGGSFVVDNRGGAGGTIGTAMVKRAAPDGYTVLVTSLGPLVIGPHLLKNLPYDPTKDLDYITVAVQAPNVLVVPAASPHKTMAEVLAFLKANPQKMSFGTSGNGSSDHITAELFWQQTGTTGLHIPYKGGGPVMTDLLGNQVDSSFMNINTALPQIKAGKLRALGITSTARSPVLPDVQTMDELGIKGVQVYSWQAVAAPKGLPADVKAKLHAGIVKTLNAADVKPKLLEQGFEIVANTPEQFTAFQNAEFERWKKVIIERKITAD